ncbi:MAG TPA: hypothetical protein VGL37_06380 [Solirubrobacteraceae bacterium]
MSRRRLPGGRASTQSLQPSGRASAQLLAVVLLLAVALLLASALAGCGKSLPGEGQDRGAGVTTVPGAGTLVASGVATKNTTRLGGADAVADAAAVALAVNPGLTPATRPAAVVLVNDRDWTAALAASALAGAPLGAPLLYAEGDTLPAISREALSALKPRGSALLGGAQVIEIDTSAAPAGYRTRAVVATTPADEAGSSATGGGAANGGAAGGGEAGGAASEAGGAAASEAALAVRIERLVAAARGGAPRRVIVVGADGPQTLAMPAAGLAAETGAPVFGVGARSIPRATRRLLASLRRPVIYAIGPPAAVSEAVLAKLSRLGTVRRIAAGPGTPASLTVGSRGRNLEATSEAVANAIAVARYRDGAFGWGVEEPGHGLVFANAARPLDAPAAAPLSASGDFGPLLLLETPARLPAAVAHYLSDIQSSYPEDEPTRGFYNHGWLIGDELAIAATTQATLDAMLEIVPHSSTGAASEASVPAEAESPTEPTSPREPTSP